MLRLLCIANLIMSFVCVFKKDHAAAAYFVGMAHLMYAVNKDDK